MNEHRPHDDSEEDWKPTMEVVPTKLCLYCDGHGVVPLDAASPAQEISDAWQPEPEVRLNDDGTLDEIVGTGWFHLEQMDHDHWWMCFESAGKRVDVWLQSKKAIKAHYEESASIYAAPPAPIAPAAPPPGELQLSVEAIDALWRDEHLSVPQIVRRRAIARTVLEAVCRQGEGHSADWCAGWNACNLANARADDATALASLSAAPVEQPALYTQAELDAAAARAKDLASRLILDPPIAVEQPAAPSAEGAREPDWNVNAEVYAFINATPLVASLLYDLNLLPECVVKESPEWGRMITVCGHMHSALAAQPQPAEACDTCRGTGQICVGTSGREDDGNAPEFERCPMCQYGEPDAAIRSAKP